MLTKFAIDYIMRPQHNARVSTHFTDDPVEAEDFVMHLLLSGARIKEIRHDGATVTDHAFDRMVKVAAERIMAAMLIESLAINSYDVRSRFGPFLLRNPAPTRLTGGFSHGPRRRHLRPPRRA